MILLGLYSPFIDLTGQLAAQVPQAKQTLMPSPPGSPARVSQNSASKSLLWISFKATPC